MTDRRFARTALASALAIAFGAQGSETAPPAATKPTPDEVRRDLYTIDSWVSLGLGVIDADNRRFGMYRGLVDEGAYALFDARLARRDEATGTWLKLSVRDLGLESREFRFDHERQGSWSYQVFGSQLTRHDPLVPVTGLAGIGTASQVVSAAAPKSPSPLRIDHDILGLSARRFLAPGLDVQLSFRQDDADGARGFGRGTPSVMEYLTEPIDRTTRQWQALANYADRKLQLAGGYAGSSYSTRYPVLATTGGNNATTVFGPAWIVALPPDNEAHQIFASGGYRFAPSTRASFKISRTVATQDEKYDPAFVRLAGSPESLGGKVQTLLGFADVVTRPRPDIDLSAQVRFEDRDDRTPVAQYLAPSAPSTSGSFSSAGVTGFNKPRSFRQAKAAVEGGWRLSGGDRVVAGIDRERLSRKPSETYRRIGFREDVDETNTRLEYKRVQGETLQGSVAWIHGERSGSEYVSDTFDPAALTNQVGSIMFADRKRDRLRLTADWSPVEPLSFQLLTDLSDDRYSGRELGAREGNAYSVAGDVSYRLNDRWSLSGWASWESLEQRQNARTDRNGAAASGFDTLWSADLRTTTRAIGASLRGKVLPHLELSVDASTSIDKVRSDLGQYGGTGTMAVTSLPGYFYRLTTLRLQADYALTRFSSVRAFVVLDRRNSNDWTWEGWTYNGAPTVPAATRTSDGTTMLVPGHEKVAFIGATYTWRFR